MAISHQSRWTLNQTIQNLLSRSALAQRLGVSKKTIERLEKSGLPRIILRPGGHPRYDFDTVNKWIASTQENGESK